MKPDYSAVLVASAMSGERCAHFSATRAAAEAAYDVVRSFIDRNPPQCHIVMDRENLYMVFSKGSIRFEVA